MSGSLPSIQADVGPQLLAIKEGLKPENSLVYDTNKNQFVSVQKSQKNDLNKNDFITKKEDIIAKVQDFVASNPISPDDLNSLSSALTEKYTIRKRSAFAETEPFQGCLRIINQKLVDELRNKFLGEVKNEFPDNVVVNAPEIRDFRDREKEILVTLASVENGPKDLELYYINADNQIAHETYRFTNFDDLENKLETLQKKRDFEVDLKNIRGHEQFGANLAPAFDPVAFENLKSTENYKIVLKSEGSTEAGHRIYFYHPTAAKIEHFVTADTSPQAVQDTLDKISRLRAVQTTVNGLSAVRLSQMSRERGFANLSAVNINTKYHFIADRDYQGFEVAFKNPANPHERFIISTAGVNDLEPTLVKCDKMIQLIESNRDDFLSNVHGPIKPDNFKVLVPDVGEIFNTTKVFLEFVDNGSKLSVHYLDPSDKKVKIHEIDINQPTEAIQAEILRISTQSTDAVSNIMTEVSHRYADKIIHEEPDIAVQASLKANKDFRIVMKPQNDENEPVHKLGYEITYFHAGRREIVTERTEGIGPEAIQETVDKIGRIHQSNDTITTYKTQPGAIPFQWISSKTKVTTGSFRPLGENGIIVQTSPDYRDFIVYFLNPVFPSEICQVREPVKDFALAMSNVQKQKEELRTLAMTTSAFSRNAASSAVEIPHPVRGAKPDALLQMFKRINWYDRTQPGFRDPTKLTNDGYHTSKESMEAALNLLIDHIANRKDRYGVPSATHPEEKEKYYQNLHALLSNIVSKLRKEENLDARNGYVLNIAEGGSHCGGRWMSDATQIYNLLTNADRLLAGEENIEQTVLGWLDGMKIGIIEEMVMEGGNVQTSHEYLMYCRALKEENIMIPAASAAEYRDPFEGSGLQGKYQTKAAIVNGFKGKFSSKRALDLVLGNLNDKMKSTRGKIASNANEVFVDYTERVILERPENREKKEQLKGFDVEYNRKKREIMEAKELTPQELEKSIEEGLKQLPELVEKAKKGKLDRAPLDNLPTFKANQMEIIFRIAENLAESLKENEAKYNQRVQKYNTSEKLTTIEAKNVKIKEAEQRFKQANDTDIRFAQEELRKMKTMREDLIEQATGQKKMQRASIIDPLVEEQKFFVLDEFDTPIAFTRNGARALLEYFGKIEPRV